MKSITSHLSIISLSIIATTALAQSSIAIITPMPSESIYLKTQIKSMQLHTKDHMRYFTGTIANQPIVLINSGIGKTNNAATTAWLQSNIHPKLVVLSGSSGDVNKKLTIGDVIVGNRVFDADYGKLTKNGPTFKYQINNPNAGKMAPMVFDPSHGFKTQLTKAMQMTKKQFPKYTYAFGTIVTSDFLPNPPWQTKLFKENKVDVVAMEDAAVDKVCWLYHMKCINIRSVSNVAGIAQTQKATEIAARNAAAVAINFIKLDK